MRWRRIGRRKDYVLVFLLAAVLLSQMIMCTVCASESADSAYRPVDVVLVIDTSGSMIRSDPERLVLQAGRTFANMMPSIDSRLGVVGFSDKSVTYTTRNGKPAFYDMSDISSVADIHDVFSNIKYDGDTGIGFGLSKAVELFQSDSRKDVSRAILVFSDGVDDLPQVQYQEAQEQLADAVAWASKNQCPIYSVGFNYRNDDGKDSLGGEGMDKLNYISKNTNASVSEVNDIKDIEQTFSDILATICGVQSDTQKVPGDGKRHEIPIEVSPGVVEMNIRIACNTEKALSTGKIELKDVDGKNIELKNKDGVRYDLEKRSANIKVTKPAVGTWTLVLDGIKGDDITIGLLNHYQISLKLQCELPKGNPADTAYSGDKVTIVAKLVDSDGKDVPKEYYDDIVSAEAEVCSRAAGSKPEKVKLTFKDGALKGEFTADGKAAYEIKAVVATPNYTKNALKVITNGNKPLELTGEEIPNQVVNVKKSIIVPDIYSYVSDAEGDEIRAEVADLSDPNTAAVQINDGSLDIKGLKWGSTVVKIVYTDVQNNTVEQSFSVKVKDPLKILLLSMIPVLIGVVVLVVVLLGLQQTRRIPGVFSIGPVSVKGTERSVSIGRPTRVQARIACKGTKSRLFSVIRTYVNMTQNQPYVTQEQAQTLLNTFSMSRDEVFNVLNSIELKGTILGKKGFVMRIPKGLSVKLNNCQKGEAIKMNVFGRNQIVFLIYKTDGTEVKISITYEQDARN